MPNRDFRFVLFLLAVVILASGFSIKQWKSSFYGGIKNEAEKSFSDLFRRKVTIESSGGIVVGSIDLKGVTFPGIGRAEKIVLNFNPVKYALAKGDMIPALTKITVIDGNFNVTRDKQGRWNFIYLTEQKPGSSPVPAFLGRVVIKNCRAAYLDQFGFRGDDRPFEANASEINGTVDLLQKGRIKFNLSGKVPELIITEGYFDVATGRYRVDISGKSLGLEKWANYAIPLSDLKVIGGTVDVNLQIAPPKIKNWPVSLTGKATINGGSVRFQSQDFKRISGNLFITDESIALENLKTEFHGNALTLNGRLNGFARPQVEGTVDIRGGKFAFSLKNNALKLTGKFAGINLATLAQKAPGIEGLAYGSIEMSGPFNNLSGKISARLSRSHIFGQPMENISSSFKIISGEFFLENFLAASGDIFFSSSGKVSRDLVFDLKAEASGLRLSGKGLFGNMQAALNRFKGNMRWKMNPDFIASPLKNLSASGEVILTGGQIGEQAFDQARGKISIGSGRIIIEDAFLQNGKTILQAGGQTGLGHPTRLKLSGQGANLEELKILNHFLPEEAKNPKGSATFEVEVTGFLSRETRIISFDPLLNLTAIGNFSAAGGSFAGMPISSVNLKFAWQDRSLSLSDCRINLPDSLLTMNLESESDGAVSGSIKGTLDLSYLKSLTARYGKVEGQTGFNAQVSGRIDDPNISVAFWINRLHFNSVYLDRLSGSFNFYRDRLTLLEPALFKNGSDLYSLSGNAEFSPGNPNESSLDLNFKILQADLGSACRLFDKLQGEFVRRFSLPSGGTESKTARVGLSRSGLTLPGLQSFVRGEAIRLYSSNGKKDFFLIGWADIRKEFEKRFASTPEENLSGNLTGSVSLKGNAADLSGRINARVGKGIFRTYEFDELAVSAGLKNRKIQIEKAVLSKGKGSVFALGNYSFNGDLLLRLTADNMPLDVMQVIFPNKIFKGNFNMNAGIDGPLHNLSFNLDLNGKSVSLAGTDFDEMKISISKKEDNVYLRELSLLHNGTLSKASGSLALSHPGEINMEANLAGNAAGIVNLFTDEIKWNRGNSSVAVEMKGTLGKPKINGNIGVADGSIYVRALDSEMQNLKGSASIENNLIIIKQLTGIWSGEKTRGYPNPVGLAGIIDLSNIMAKNNMVGLDLNFSPTRLFAAFPNQYVGALEVKELSLKGPLYFDLSQGPALKGKVEASDAVITLSQPSGRQGKVFPLNFDLEAALKKNVYAVMGDVATLNLSNIFMNLEIASENLIISGNLASPSLLGKVAIKRGTVNIFNNEFTLLSPETQKKYFPYDAEKIQENTARFSGEEGPAGAMPDINLTASVNVENPEKDESGKYIKKQVNILARLKGTLGAKEETRGLKIALSSFREDRTKSPPEIIPAAYGEQDLKVMLLPDFIKTLAGIGQPEETGQEKIDTNLIVADYLSSRMQTLLFRGIERQIEQNLGLESLTLEYNLGPKVREAMGIKEVKGFEEEKPAWSVGFVKGFTDRLFIDVRYSQGMEQTTGTGAKTSINYQLTYKITPIWSIIYYREPISLQEISTGYQKVTLKSGFSLW